MLRSTCFTDEAWRLCGEVQRGDFEGVQLCEEGRELPTTPPYGSPPLRSPGYDFSDDDEEAEGAVHHRHDRGWQDSGRPGRRGSRLCDEEPESTPELLSVPRTQGEEEGLCRGPGDEGPCPACRWLLWRLESSDCILGEFEYSDHEGPSSEADLDPGPSGHGEDLLCDDA